MDNFGVNAAPEAVNEEDSRPIEILNNTSKKINNNFQVGLLWREKDVHMPESCKMAEQRIIGISDCAVLTPSITSSKAARVDLFGLNPCCLMQSPLAAFTDFCIHGFRKRSRSSPAMASMQSGRQADGNFGSPFPLLIRTKRCRFHTLGNIRFFRHALYMPSNSCGCVSVIILSISFIFIFSFVSALAAVFSSCSVKNISDSLFSYSRKRGLSIWFQERNSKTV